MQQDWGIIFAFGLYFLALFGIGIFHMKKEQDLAGYVLGCLLYTSPSPRD